LNNVLTAGKMLMWYGQLLIMPFMSRGLGMSVGAPVHAEQAAVMNET
jgi:hypothetical protein